MADIDPGEPLKRYWSTGPGGREIGWGTPGAFTRCVLRLGKYMTPENAKGYCAERAHDATGEWPGQHHDD